MFSFQNTLKSKTKFKEVPIIQVTENLPSSKQFRPTFKRNAQGVPRQMDSSTCPNEFGFIKSKPGTRMGLFYIGWDLKQHDLRRNLSDIMRKNNLFSDGDLLTTIEDSSAWDSEGSVIIAHVL